MESTEKREAGPFHSVDIRGVGRVILAAAEEPSVEVAAERSLLARIRTEVRGRDRGERRAAQRRGQRAVPGQPRGGGRDQRARQAGEPGLGAGIGLS